MATQLTSRRKELDDFFARQENAKLKDRVAFLNSFIDESSFDWTRMLRGVFDQLGGKGGGTKDFARGGLADPAKASAALAVAESLLKQS